LGGSTPPPGTNLKAASDAGLKYIDRPSTKLARSCPNCLVTPLRAKKENLSNLNRAPLDCPHPQADAWSFILHSALEYSRDLRLGTIGSHRAPGVNNARPIDPQCY